MPPLLYSVLGRLVICLFLCSPLLAQSAPPPKATPPPDLAAYVVSQFGSAFTLDPTIPPMFGDLDGDGNEDLILVGQSGAPLQSKEQLHFSVEDPYDAYFGTGDTRITSMFTLHFDGSARCILVVFGWRLPPESRPKAKAKIVSKFVLINTPFETIKIVDLRLKKKNLQAIETVDRDTLHALVFWDGKRWHWRAEGMEGDDTLMPRRN
jgi:hypothetical protein